MKTFNLLTTYLILLTFLLLPCKQVKAESCQPNQNSAIRCITVIEEETVPPIMTYATTKTASKTCYYQNSNGVTLWYVTVTATFSYNGTSATCKSASVTADSYNSNWKVSNKQSSFSGNKATASATGKQYYNSTVIQTINRTITLTCSKDGSLS